MAKRLKERPFPNRVFMQSAVCASSDALRFGVIALLCHAYWRNGNSPLPESSQSLAILGRVSLPRFRAHEAEIRQALDEILPHLDQAKREWENQVSGISSMIDAANAKRRAQSAEARRSKVNAPGRMAPARTQTQRRIAVEHRQAAVAGFVD